MSRILYLGLELPHHYLEKNIVHCPFIRIIPKSADDKNICAAFKNFDSYSHLIFTSKSAVEIFLNLLSAYNISKDKVRGKTMISVGEKTAQRLRESEIHVDEVAHEETAEGVVQILASMELAKANFFLPQSSLSRPVISNWLKENKIDFTVCSVYETVFNFPEPLPNLDLFNQIVFTSPSTVDAFIKAYGVIPKGKELTCIGPVTERHLEGVISIKT